MSGPIERALRNIAKAANAAQLVIRFAERTGDAPVEIYEPDQNRVLGAGRDLPSALAAAAGELHARAAAERVDQYKKLELAHAVAAELRATVAELVPELNDVATRVRTVADRDAIPASQRWLWMKVEVVETGVTYALFQGITNEHWAIVRTL